LEAFTLYGHQNKDLFSNKQIEPCPVRDFRKSEIAMEKKQNLISALNLLDVQLRKMFDRETKYKRTECP